MKKIFKLGILITPKIIHIGLVENKFVSLLEKKYKTVDFDFKNIESEIENFVKEVGLKLTDIDCVNLVDELNTQDTVSLTIESIKLNKLASAGWILNSNWMYTLDEIEAENILEYSPIYPYLTVYSDAASTDLILNESETDSKIVGSFSDEAPELLIDEAIKILEIDSNEFDDLISVGDPNELDFDYELETDMDLRITSIKVPLRKQYESKLAEYSRFEEPVKSELITNLKADLIVSLQEKLFDYINTKLFAIADAMQVKVISLVGEFWLNQRFQEKMIRIAIGSNIKIKFPDSKTPLPLGSFVASTTKKTT